MAKLARDGVDLHDADETGLVVVQEDASENLLLQLQITVIQWDRPFFDELIMGLDNLLEKELLHRHISVECGIADFLTDP